MEEEVGVREGAVGNKVEGGEKGWRAVLLLDTAKGSAVECNEAERKVGAPV